MDENNQTDTWVLIESVKPDKNQPRKTFSESHIKGLAASFLQEGMINHIEVDDSLTIITGECRYRAAQLLKWEKIPVRINPKKYSEYERLRHQMAENLHQSGEGEQMNPLEVAKAWARMYELKTGKSYEPGSQLEFGGEGTGQLKGAFLTIAEEVGVSKHNVWEHLKLLEQPEFVQKALQEGLPRTYIREADKAPEEFKEPIKQKLVEGEYKSRDEIIQDVQILRKIPDLAQSALERQKAKESQATNRILNGIARLALALEALPLDQVSTQEKNIVVKQLQWLEGKIQSYLINSDKKEKENL